MQRGCLGILTSIDSGDVSPMQAMCNVALLDHWLHFYRLHCHMSDIYVICRSHEHSEIVKWARSRNVEEDYVVKADDEIAALSIIINIQATRQHAITAIAHIHTVLLPDVFTSLVETIETETSSIMHNITSTALFSVHSHASIVPLHTYFTQPNAVRSIVGFQQWCLQQPDILKVMTPSIFNLHDSATQATSALQKHYTSRISSLPTSWIQKCYARVGLMGNPSDGFNGKTVSFTIENFSAQVTLAPLETVDIVPHPINDTHAFPSLDQLMQQTELHVLRLLDSLLSTYFI